MGYLYVREAHRPLLPSCKDRFAYHRPFIASRELSIGKLYVTTTELSHPVLGKCRCLLRDAKAL
jgi:hypothetical protein